MKPKVFLVAETGSLSGGVRVIGDIANHLKRRGWDVSIWSLNPKETLTSWFKLDSGIDWISFFRTGTITDYEQLVHVLKRHEGIKVATYWRTAPAVAEASKSGEGYYLVQDIETSYASTPKLKEAVMDTYELGLHHFTTSRWVEKQIDTDYMGIGVDTAFYRRTGVRKEKLMILATARQVALKGWPVLCELNRKLASKGLPMTMFGLSERMRVFVPPVEYFVGLDDDHVLELYNRASIFVSTSLHEGFNLTALEAMACGTPVVKTRDDGSDEYVDDGGNCMIGNDATQLAEKVLEVIGNTSLSKTLSINGQATAKRYQWKDAIDRLEKIFGA